MSLNNTMVGDHQLESLANQADCIYRGRVEFERALDNVLQTHTWPQILALMVNNEREHHD